MMNLFWCDSDTAHSRRLTDSEAGEALEVDVLDGVHFAVVCEKRRAEVFHLEQRFRWIDIDVRHAAPGQAGRLFLDGHAAGS